jgi:predicted patatin/cPLA2 family phospholipase
VLKAATAIPILYNRTVDVEGRPCMDAGLAIPFPLEQAIANGCTDLLVLLTRSAKYRSRAPSRASRWLFNRVSGRGNAELCRIYARHHERSIAARDMAFGRSPTPSGVNIATICTADPATIHRTTVDSQTLREAAVNFAKNTLRIFGADADTWSLGTASGG